MNNVFYYQLYNLVLASPMPCDLLPLANHQCADVVISFEKCPQAVTPSSGKMLLKIADVASFYITSGKSITVELCSNADMKLVWTYVLGSVIGVILQQRGLLVLHGNSVVDRDGQAIMFVAHSGGGKSTLTAVLLKAGYQVLSDDVSAIYFDADDTPWVTPGYGKIKLWQETIEALNIDNKNQQQVSIRQNKFYLDMSDLYRKKPAPLKAIYLLEPSHAFCVRQLFGVRKLLTLIEHSYRFRYVADMHLKEHHFRLCDLLLKKIHVNSLSRPMNDVSNHQVINWLQSGREADSINSPISTALNSL